MKKKALILFSSLLFGLAVQAQVAYEFVPSEWTTSDAGRVSSSNFTYDDEQKTLYINASGNNNTCFMLDNAYSNKYYITSDKNYFVVKGDKLDTGAGCSLIWWFNGFNQGGSEAPNFAVGPYDGYYYIIWRVDNNPNINHYMDYSQEQIIIGNNNQSLINAMGLTSLGSTGSTIYDINFYSIKEIVTNFPALAAEMGYDVASLQLLIDKAQKLYDNSTAAAGLNSYIAQANAALTATTDDICDAVDSLTSVLASFETWNNLLALIGDATAKYELYVGELGSDDLLTAINAAKTSLNSSDEATIKTAITALQEALTTFQLYHIPEEGVDMTSYVVNASFLDCATSTSVGDLPDGWSIIIESNGDTVRTSAQAKNYFNNWVGVNDYSSNPYRGDCGTRVFGIWTAAIPAFEFSQTINDLPDGSYQVKCWMAVGGGGGNRMTDQRLFANTAEQLYSEVAQNNPGDDGPFYQLTADAFVSNGTITFGVRTGGGTADGNGWYKVGNFTLTYFGLTAQFALQDLQDVVLDYLNNNVDEMVPGIAYILDDQLQASYDFIGSNVADEDALNAYKELLAVYEQTKQSMTVTANIRTLISQLETLSESNYPGHQTLITAIETAADYLSDENATYQGLLDLYAGLGNDRIAYIFSQTVDEGSAADVSAVISVPSFRAPGEENVQEAVRSSEGWKTDNVSNGGDYATYFNMGNTCWNSWSNNFTSMKVYQELGGLPAGVYSVTCKAITQAGCLNDQHAFIQAGVIISNSSAMTIEGWDASGSFVAGSGTVGEGIWEDMPTGKVKLAEGETLVIGFASTYDAANVSNNVSNGWFCVTDFQLLYYGTEDSNLFTEAVEKAEAAKAEVTLLGDIAHIDSLIVLAKTTKESNETEAFVLLSQAESYAHASVSAYEAFMTGQYDELLSFNMIDESSTISVFKVSDAMLEKIENVLNGEKTVYPDLVQWSTDIDGYMDYLYYDYNVFGLNYNKDDYAVEYVEKFEALEKIQTDAMAANVLSPETVAAYLLKLKYAVKDMLLSRVIVATGSVDLSFMIDNRSFEEDGEEQTSIFAPPTGWSIFINETQCFTAQDIEDNGLVGWCGANTDADETKTDNFIFGIWNMSIPKFEISQTIGNMPNGHYTLSVDMATPTLGELSRTGGQCVFLNDAESYFKDYLIDEETGIGEYYEATTDRGPLQTIRVEFDVTDNTLHLGVRSDNSKAFADSLMATAGVGWFKIDNFVLTGDNLTIPENWVIDTKVAEPQSTSKEVVSRSYYNLQGVQLREPVKGIIVVRTIFNDGNIKVEKVRMK